MKNYCFILLLFTLSFYAQNDTISVVKHTDNDLIFPKNKKVLFRGVPNEIFINVPNCKSFKAFADGLKLIKNNVYNFTPSAGSETTLTIEIVLKNNKKKIEKHIFEIRNIKTPITYFNYIRGDTIVRAQKNHFKNAIIRIITADKNFNLNFKVTQFYLKIPRQNTIVVNGDKIDDNTFQLINKYASKHDEISISNIKVRTNPPFMGCILVSPMIIQIF